MAISWGTAAGSSSNEEKVGIEITQSPATVLTGTSSVTLTAKIWLWTKYRYSDSQTLTLSGGWSGSYAVSVSTPSNSSYSTSNQLLIKTVTKVVTPSTAASIVTSLTAKMSGLYTGGAPYKTSSITTAQKPQSGYPTLSPGTLDFSNPATLCSFIASGDSSYTIKSVSAKLLKVDGTDSLVIPTTNRVPVLVGGAYAVPFTDAERGAILDYWQDTARDTTTLQLTVVTTVNGVDSPATVVPVAPPLVADLYRITSVWAERATYDAGSVNSLTQYVSVKVSGVTASPWYQASIWPSRLLSATVVLGTGSPATLTAQSIALLSAVYAATDSVPLAMASTRTYTARLFRYLTQLGDDAVCVLSSPQPLLAIRKDASTGEKRIGINTASPSCALEVVGSIKTNGSVIIPDAAGDSFATVAKSDNTLIQSGWGYVASSAATVFTKSITFPVAFDDVPIVSVTAIGSLNTTIPTSPAFTGANVNLSGAYTSVSPSAVTAKLLSSATLAAGYYIGFTWIAIGAKA